MSAAPELPSHPLEKKRTSITLQLNKKQFGAAQDELIIYHGAARAYLAASTLGLITQKAFDNELLFEDWFDAALSLTQRDFKDPIVTLSWLTTMIELGQQTDPIARSYLQDMIGVTPFSFYELTEATGSNPSTYLQRIKTSLCPHHDELIGVIEQLIQARYSPEPFVPVTPQSSVESSFAKDPAVNKFATLIKKDIEQAYTYVSKANEPVKPFMYAFSADTYVELLLKDSKKLRASLDKIMTMAQTCHYAPLSIKENDTSWLQAIDHLCQYLNRHKHDTYAIQVTQAMVDATPHDLFSRHSSSWGNDPLDWLEKRTQRSGYMGQYARELKANWHSSGMSGRKESSHLFQTLSNDMNPYEKALLVLRSRTPDKPKHRL